jgi:hypothetical protein
MDEPVKIALALGHKVPGGGLEGRFSQEVLGSDQPKVSERRARSGHNIACASTDPSDEAPKGVRVADDHDRPTRSLAGEPIVNVEVGHRTPTGQSSIRDRLQERKAKSQDQERLVARVLPGSVIPGSGSLGISGDVRTDELLISCKQTEKRSFLVELAEVKKATREADEQELTPALALHFRSAPEGVEEHWLLVPMRVAASWIAKTKQGGDHDEE